MQPLTTTVQGEQALAMLTELATGRLSRDRFTKDASWWSNSGQSFPLDDFIAILATLHQATVGGIVIDPTRVIEQGEAVVVEATSDVPLTNGGRYANRYLFLIHFQNGRIREVREYNDTAHVAAAFNLGAATHGGPVEASTPAGRLARNFGDVDAMRALYAPGVTWTISASLGMPRLEGVEAVSAFNRQVWTEHHRPDCQVTILDEVGDETKSAVRFTYRAFSLFPQDWYENEYTLLVHAGPDGITAVVEAFDTSATIDFLARRPIGSGWRSLSGEVGEEVAALGRS